MANITRRNERESRGLARPQGYYEGPLRPGFDPFRMIGDLLRWDPFGAEYERGGGLLQRGSFSPSVDLRETPQALVFQVDLPGVKEDNIEISVTGNRLTIGGQREEEKREDTERYHSYECSYGSFSRAFTLPEGTDPDNVKAEMKDGVLLVTVPKRPEVQSRRIDIGAQKAGDGGKGQSQKS